MNQIARERARQKLDETREAQEELFSLGECHSVIDGIIKRKMLLAMKFALSHKLRANALLLQNGLITQEEYNNLSIENL